MKDDNFGTLRRSSSNGLSLGGSLTHRHVLNGLNIHRWFRLSIPLSGLPIVVLVSVLIIVVATVL